MLLWGLHSVESSEADAKVSITARLNQDKTKAKDYNNDQVAMAAQLEPINQRSESEEETLAARRELVGAYADDAKALFRSSRTGQAMMQWKTWWLQSPTCNPDEVKNDDYALEKQWVSATEDDLHELFDGSYVKPAPILSPAYSAASFSPL